MLTLLLAGCGTLVVTPITTPPTDTYHEGKVVWHDLLTTDIDAAKAFYAGVLDWTFEEKGRYTLVSNDGAAIAGMVRVRPKAPESGPDRWLMSLSVADVDASAQRLASAGGTVHEGPEVLEGRGRFALVSDPQGAELVLLHSSSGDPPETDETAFGAFLWNELWSNDVTGSIAFYEELGQYTAIAAPELPEYWILTRDERWRAGVRTAVFENLRAQWVPGIRVSDPAAVMDRVEAYGGQALIHPGQASNDPNVGLFSDPGGALMIVHRWPRQDTGDET